MLAAMTSAVASRLQEAAAAAGAGAGAGTGAEGADPKEKAHAEAQGEHAVGVAVGSGRDNATGADGNADISNTGIPFEKLARIAELICATNTSSPAATSAVASLARRHVVPAVDSPRKSQLDPKLMAMWCLQMAAAGVEEAAVFAAVAEVVVERCERASDGKKRGGKGRWIVDSSPPLQSMTFLAKVATLLASAGVQDQGLFNRIAAVAAATPEIDELAALKRQSTSAEQLAEMHSWHERRLNAFAEMRAGIFGYFAQLPMLLTHKADCAMHGQMTAAALPAGWDAAASVDDRLADAIASFDDPTLPVVIDFGCGQYSFLTPGRKPPLRPRICPGTPVGGVSPPEK